MSVFIHVYSGRKPLIFPAVSVEFHPRNKFSAPYSALLYKRKGHRSVPYTDQLYCLLHKNTGEKGMTYEAHLLPCGQR
jgi:hypothetical protein